jgi:DNA-binding response OmpR family regulator
MRSDFPDNICIVEDEHELANFLIEYLAARGCNATHYASAEKLMSSGRIKTYDFFILDLGLAGMDGIDCATLIRGRSSAGILIISGRIGPDAFNSALNAGADMFVSKPVRFDQVYHAIAAVWRRSKISHIEAMEWRIDASATTLTSPRGTAITVSPVEGRIIMHLLAAKQAPVSRAELATASGITGGVDHRNLDAAIFRLRRKIEKDAGQPSPLRTVHGHGYQLDGTVMV